MRGGFSLIELVLALAVAGLLVLIAVPRLSGALDQIEVDAAASQVVGAHQRARMMAIARGQVLTLVIDSAELAIASRVDETPLWLQHGPAAAGVALTGSARRFTFAPTGVTLGLSNASLILSRGASQRTVLVSRLGRVRVVR